MGRKRQRHLELPRRVYRPYSMYYYVPKPAKSEKACRIPLGRSFAAAMAAYGRLVAYPGRPKSLATMGALLDRYQVEVLPTKAPRTQQDNMKELARLRDYFGQMHPHDLTAQHVYQYMDDRKAPVRANREKALLSHVCALAIRWGAMASNPCRDVKRNPEYPRVRYVTDSEMATFKQAAPKPLQVYVDFKYATAIRKGDILALRLTQLTDEGIEYYESKKRRRRRVTRAGQLVVEEVKPRRRLVRWTPELRAIVERAKGLPRRAGEEHLFTGRDGRQLTTGRFDTMWQRAMRKAAAGGTERFTEHDLRAKSATDEPGTAAHRLGDTEEQARAYIRNKTVDIYDPIPLPRLSAAEISVTRLERSGNVIPFRQQVKPKPA